MARRGTFAWQAWHKLTSTVVLRGRRGTTSHPPSFCVAGVAQTHMATVVLRGSAWHWLGRHSRDALCDAESHFCRGFAWHNLTSTVVLRGRRGTHGTGWRAWTGLGARRDARDAAALLRGRRGTN